jgi:hypothetical protein
MIIKFFKKKWPFTAKSWWTEYHPTLTDSSEKGISFLDLVIKKKKKKYDNFGIWDHMILFIILNN